MALRQRTKAIQKYMKNPSICKQCGLTISIKDNDKVCEVKKKQFCSCRCSVIYNNRKRPRKYLCKLCRKPIGKGQTMMCRQCWHKDAATRASDITKGELKIQRCGYQSYRSTIRKHAQTIYTLSGLPQKCQVCGYEKHIEIAHKKSVSSFPDSATLGEINHIDNLSPLCPNHHWEHDNGILVLTGSGRGNRTPLSD